MGLRGGVFGGGEIGGVLGGGERGERGEGGYEAYEITHGGIDGMRITKRGGGGWYASRALKWDGKLFRGKIRASIESTYAIWERYGDVLL